MSKKRISWILAFVLLAIAAIVLLQVNGGQKLLTDNDIATLVEERYTGKAVVEGYTGSDAGKIAQVRLQHAKNEYLVHVSASDGRIMELTQLTGSPDAGPHSNELTAGVSITERQARTIAIEHTGESAVDSITLAKRDGKPFYDVRLVGMKAGRSIQLEVDASTGTVTVVPDMPAVPAVPPSGQSAQEPGQQQSDDDETESAKPAAKITEEEARRIALAKVPGTVTSIKLDNDDDGAQYIVSIDSSGAKSTIYVNGHSGEIISISTEARQFSNDDDGDDATDDADD